MAVAKEESAREREIDHVVAIAMTVAATKLRNLAEAARTGGPAPGAKPEETADANVTVAAECQG